MFFRTLVRFVTGTLAYCKQGPQSGAVSLARILLNTDSLQLGRSYTACLCLVSSSSSALPILGLITSSTASINGTTAPQTCCSGGHRTAAAPAAIAPASSSSLISASISTPRHEAATGITDYSTTDFVTSSLNATVPIMLGMALFLLVGN